jgi:hypothetical protein
MQKPNIAEPEVKQFQQLLGTQFGLGTATEQKWGSSEKTAQESGPIDKEVIQFKPPKGDIQHAQIVATFKDPVTNVLMYTVRLVEGSKKETDFSIPASWVVVGDQSVEDANKTIETELGPEIAIAASLKVLADLIEDVKSGNWESVRNFIRGKVTQLEPVHGENAIMVFNKAMRPWFQKHFNWTPEGYEHFVAEALGKAETLDRGASTKKKATLRPGWVPPGSKLEADWEAFLDENPEYREVIERKGKMGKRAGIPPLVTSLFKRHEIRRHPDTIAEMKADGADPFMLKIYQDHFADLDERLGR